MTCATTYDYRDAGGKFLYGVERRPQKQFRQFRIDEQGKKIWNVAGVPRVPYRLPELLAGISDGEIVVCAEGEKDVDNLSGLGFCELPTQVGLHGHGPLSSANISEGRRSS